MKAAQKLTPDSVLESVPSPAEIRQLIKESLRHSSALRCLLRAAEARDKLKRESCAEAAHA